LVNSSSNQPLNNSKIKQTQETTMDNKTTIMEIMITIQMQEQAATDHHSHEATRRKGEKLINEISV
jgi:hypothetical protein